MDIILQDESFYITQPREVLLKYVWNGYCAKRLCLPVIKHERVLNNTISSSVMASISGQCSYDPYDLSSFNEEYLMLENVAKMTPRQSDHAARLLAAARLHLNQLPDLPQTWRQINLNHNDYHSDPMEISKTCWIPDIMHWWPQQEETHSKYTDLSNVALNIFSIIAHGVDVEASISLGGFVMGGRQSKSAGKTVRDRVVEKLFAQANHRFLVGDDPALDIGYDEYR